MALRTFNLPHDITHVFTKLTDPGFIIDRSHAMGELDASCDVQNQSDRVQLNISRTVSHDADKLPKIMRRFGLKQTVTIKEEWWDEGDGKAGHFSARPGKLPIHMEAELRLTPAPTGCVLSVSSRCHVDVPLLGGTLAPLMIEQRQKDLDQELAFLREALA